MLAPSIQDDWADQLFQERLAFSKAMSISMPHRVYFLGTNYLFFYFQDAVPYDKLFSLAYSFQVWIC